MKAFKTKMMVGAVAAAVLTIDAAQAAESVKTDAIKVTATRVEKELSDVNMSVSIITEEQIKHSTARNVGELLQDIPGIEINPDGGQGMKRVNIRGENAFRTVVMIDGQKVAEHKSMSGAPMLIDPSQIERIEVIKGPASVLYGSDAIGGVINIITKKGGERPFQGNVSVGYNTSADGYSGSASLFGSNNGWNYRLSAAYEDNGDLKTPVGDMPNTAFNSKTANLFVSYDINSDATVGGSLDYYELEFHSSSYDYEFPGFRVDVDPWKRSKAALFGEFRNVTENLVRLRADVFYQKSEKEMVNTVPGEMRNPQKPFPMPYVVSPTADNTINQYGVSIQSDWQLGEKHYLVAGYEMSYDKLDADTIVHASFMPNSPMSNKTHDGYQMSNAVYASMESLLPADFTLTYGVRYTWVESDMNETKRPGVMSRPGTTNQYTHKESDDGKAVFNAGILWNGIENLTLRASYAQGYRNPILQELYIDTMMGQGMSTTYSNAALKPETSDNFEIGARWTNGAASVDATVFYTQADDYIAVTREGRKDIYNNIAKAKSYGLELAASAYLGESGFEPYVNLTMMKRQYDNGVDWKTWDTGTPLVTATYGVRWAGEQNGLAVRWNAYCRSQSKSEYKGKDAEDYYNYGGYTTFNLTGGIDFGAQKQYSMDFGLYNVFDKLYQHQGAIYEPGRYAAVKFNAQF